MTVKKLHLISKWLPLFLAGLFTTIAFTSCKKSSSSNSSIDGDWKRISEFDGNVRSEAVTFTINDTVYVGGGYDGTNRLNDFWYLNQTGNYWKQVANFPGTARNSAVAFSINGKGYVGTGVDDNGNMLNDFWEFDPAKNTWTRKADFAGTPRYGSVGFAINGEGYIATGYDGTYLKDLWQYNPASDSWTQKASLGGSKRSDAVEFNYQNKAYVVTGVNNGSYLNDFWVYDPSNDTWSALRAITNVSTDNYDDLYTSITRSNAMIFCTGDTAELTCGTSNGVIGTTWEYDIANDQWNQKTTFEGTARQGGVAYTVNGSGYIMGGNNSSNYFDDVWQFIPNVAADPNDN